MIARTASKPWLMLAALSTLVACGDGSAPDTASGEADADPAVPSIDAAGGGGGPLQVRIEFPPPSATIADHIEVRGTAVADESISGVIVGEVAAESDDGFATWRARVPLALGANDLAVDVDLAGAQHTDVAGVAIERWAAEVDGQRGAGAWPGRMLGVAFDRVGSRAIVSDDVSDGVSGIAAATGDRVVLSDSESTVEVGSGFELVRPTHVAVRGDTAWVTDEDVLVTIDLASGDRVELARPGPTSAISADPNGDRILILGGGIIQDVDQTSGALTPMTGSGPGLDGAHRMDVDWTRGRAVVLRQYSDDVIAIDLATGARSLVPNPSGIEFANPAQVAALDDGTALVWSDSQLVRVDLDTGARAVVTGPGVQLRGVQAMAVSPLGVVVVEYVPDWEDAPRPPMLIAVDPTDGARVILAR